MPELPRLNKSHREHVCKVVSECKEWVTQCMKEGVGIEHPQAENYRADAVDAFIADQLQAALAINVQLRIAAAMGMRDLYESVLTGGGQPEEPDEDEP